MVQGRVGVGSVSAPVWVHLGTPTIIRWSSSKSAQSSLMYYS